MEKFNLAADSFGPEEIEAGIAVLRSGRYTMGEQVARFETELARWTGAKHAVMVNSGSSANLLMIESLVRRSLKNETLKPGDEVLVPALSWPTTVWPLLQLGLVPVFTDVDPHTLAIDVESARKSLSPKTKAMFLIHVLGLAADMSALTAFCRENGLILMEDCCESFGAFYEGRHVGLFGRAGSLSHFFSHHLTTMEGGTILTDDSALYDDLKSFRAHGWLRDRSDKDDWVRKYPDFDPRFMFITTGYNVRPMEIQAAIGLVQLKKMDDFLQRRDQLARRVLDVTAKKTPFVRLIGGEFLKASARLQERRHSWMNLPFAIDPSSKLDRKSVMRVLEDAGVETRPIIAGNLSLHPACKSLPTVTRTSLAVCDEILSRGFMIGCHPTATGAQVETLEKAFAALGKLA